jgi:hypothetical protein
VIAIDWEYGTLQGFPGLDLAHYMLQTNVLIYRSSPIVAAQRAARFVSCSLMVSSEEGGAIVRLAAYNAHRSAVEDGHPTTTLIQRWRQAIWESQWHA